MKLTFITIRFLIAFILVCGIIYILKSFILEFFGEKILFITLIIITILLFTFGKITKLKNKN
jgi:hypothetical protein